MEPSAPGTLTIFGVFPETILLGPGDDVAMIGLAAASISADTIEVTDRMRLQSSNEAVVRVAGSRVIGVAPGQADVLVTFQNLSATRRATVFAPSSVSRLVLYGTGGRNPCWPNEGLELGVDAVLDDGNRINARPVAWLSTAPAVASVDAAGRVTCLTPGQATIEARYQGKTVSMAVTVRVPQDTLEFRGSSISGLVERGRTVTIGTSGFYVLVSGASAEIVQTIRNADGSLIGSPSTVTAHRGSAPWHLTTTFVVPASATSLCPQVVMRIDGSSRTFELPPLGCSPVS